MKKKKGRVKNFKFFLNIRFSLYGTWVFFSIGYIAFYNYIFRDNYNRRAIRPSLFMFYEKSGKNLFFVVAEGKRENSQK